MKSIFFSLKFDNNQIIVIYKVYRIIVMKLINFAIKSAFITGALTAGAFLTGATLGMLVNKEKVLDKFKKMQIKKNKSASTK